MPQNNVSINILDILEMSNKELNKFYQENENYFNSENLEEMINFIKFLKDKIGSSDPKLIFNLDILQNKAEAIKKDFSKSAANEETLMKLQSFVSKIPSVFSQVEDLLNSRELSLQNLIEEFSNSQPQNNEETDNNNSFTCK